MPEINVVVICKDADEAGDIISLLQGTDTGVVVNSTSTTKSAKSVKAAKPVDDGLDDDLDDDDEPADYTEKALAGMAVSDLKKIAADEFDIDIKGLKKAELVEEILAAQDDEDEDLDEDEDEDEDEDDEDDLDDDLDDDDEDDDLDDDDEDDEPEPAPARRRARTPAPTKAVAPRGRRK